MSGSDSPALQTVNERELNQQLEFDSDWEATQPGTDTVTDKNIKCNGCLVNWVSSMSHCVCSIALHFIINYLFIHFTIILVRKYCSLSFSPNLYGAVLS